MNRKGYEKICRGLFNTLSYHLPQMKWGISHNESITYNLSPDR